MKRGSKVTIDPKEAKWILDHLYIYDIPGEGFNEIDAPEVRFYMALAMYGKPLAGEVFSIWGDVGIVRFKAPNYKFFAYGKIEKGKFTV